MKKQWYGRQRLRVVLSAALAALVTATIEYFLVAADGGAFTFRNARFHGSLPGEHISVRDIVGITLTSDDGGYWMAGAGGVVFAFDNASGGLEQQVVSSNLPVAAIAST